MKKIVKIISCNSIAQSAFINSESFKSNLSDLKTKPKDKMGEKILTLETSVSLRGEEDEILVIYIIICTQKSKFPENFQSIGFNMSFNNSSEDENDIELKANQVYLCWNVTGKIIKL